MKKRTLLWIIAILALVAVAAGIVATRKDSQPAGEIVGAPKTCKGWVALTFDDGPTPMTPQILAILGKYDIKAMFFNLGKNEKLRPGMVELTEKAGMQFGNHTETHQDLLKLKPAQIIAEVATPNKVHAPMAGQYDFFRPPFGNTSSSIRGLALRLGMVEVLWTVDSKDYLIEKPEQVPSLVEKSKGMTDGGILLLHDGHKFTIEALSKIINHYHTQGLCFGKIAVSEQEQFSPSLGMKFNAKAVKP